MLERELQHRPEVVMRKRPAVSITSDGWVRRVCVRCASVYWHPRNQPKPSRASITWVIAYHGIVRWARSLLRDDPPCPRCGCVQPDVIARHKWVRHLTFAVVWLTVAIYLCFFASVALEFTYSTASLILGIGSAGVLIAQGVVATANLNASHEKNLARARALIERGELELGDDPPPDVPTDEPKASSPAAFPLLLVGLVCVVVMFNPFVLKSLARWPEAPGNKPEVVGPGDTVRVWCSQKIQAVQGCWSGAVTRATVDVGGGPQPAVATTHTERWGQTISGKSVSSVSASPWVEVVLPADPQLAGKTVVVEATLDVEYPRACGPGEFDNAFAELDATGTYTLAEPGVSGTYRQSFWLAVGSIALFTLCGVGLMLFAMGLRRRPTSR